MMIWPTWIILAVVNAAPTDRIPVDCTVSEATGSIYQGPNDVTSVRCDERDGFFVPSGRYRELRDVENFSQITSEENQILKEKAAALTLAVESLTVTSSAAEEETGVYKRLYELQTQALSDSEERSQHHWYEHPGVWIGVGIVATVAVTIGIANLLPDRVITSQ